MTPVRVLPDAARLAEGRAVHFSVTVDGVSEDALALRWHGALSADVILSRAGVQFIDINPRLVEPVNALASGVDLVRALVEVACTGTSRPQPPGPRGCAPRCSRQWHWRASTERVRSTRRWVQLPIWVASPTVSFGNLLPSSSASSSRPSW